MPAFAIGAEIEERTITGSVAGDRRIGAERWLRK
jgi:hypothetical protein